MPDPGTRKRSSARVLTEVVTRLRRTLRASIRTDFPWEAVPMAQIELLMAVQDHQPVRVGRLAELLRLAPNTVSGLVQQLVDAGLTTRDGDPADRRVSLISLAGAGLDRLADWDRAHRLRIGGALAALPKRDRAAIVSALPALDRLASELARSMAGDQPDDPDDDPD